MNEVFMKRRNEVVPIKKLFQKYKRPRFLNYRQFYYLFIKTFIFEKISRIFLHVSWTQNLDKMFSIFIQIQKMKNFLTLNIK